jgi:hypothetical protein
MSFLSVSKRLIIIMVFMLGIVAVIGCATTASDPMAARLAAMSDEELISYYHGINDRLKEIQQGTRDADRQGTVTEQDQLAKMPYIIGGEAWELEQKRERVSRELNRRNLQP